MPYTSLSGLQVDDVLRVFVRDELLPSVGISEDDFWGKFAQLQDRFAGPVADVLAQRDTLQTKIDAWHIKNGGGTVDEYAQFLTDIGYLLEPVYSTISVTGVDEEFSTIPGAQLVVPATVPRYALNAANARWGSLFDAYYGTDALPLDYELAPGYDPRRGAQVIAEVDTQLDGFFPLVNASHADVTAYSVVGGRFLATTGEGTTTLADPTQFVGYREGGILLRRNGAHVEIVIDPDSVVGQSHHAGVADVVVEAAITTIVDLEDSVATVDGEDKTLAYSTWFGLHRGDLASDFDKDGATVHRTLNPDRHYLTPGGADLVLHGRSLLLARTVGHHMTTDAVLTADGREVIEGVLDALVVVTASLQDLRGLGSVKNSRTGSIYIVKPKQHGPAEVALTVEIFGAIEEALGLEKNTVKIGIMDEEKRTSLNLDACIAAASERVIFINTGFLDRTGDEIHTDFAAGPVVRKNDMKSQIWLSSYEDNNVDAGLAAGFSGVAQVGKGMWAKPAAMADMLAQKIGHPLAGANCAWVPSPTAATLHALHYLKVNVFDEQKKLIGRRTDRKLMLNVPLLTTPPTPEEIDNELRTNAQSMLGYVVRWVGLGIGCSTVPDLNNVGLMEDRATLRISSQLLANWLAHGIVDEAQIRAVFAQMAVLVDEQNASVEGYPAMAPNLEASESFQAALELVFTGKIEPNGYTERVLTYWRKEAKKEPEPDMLRRGLNVLTHWRKGAKKNPAG
ncbi:MAG: malate synthase G [Propionibacteriaceae bacterium]|jgi:malate synthase|nr:malate synthase G [Propionibacteriaceae bacterium]